MYIIVLQGNVSRETLRLWNVQIVSRETIEPGLHLVEGKALPRPSVQHVYVVISS